MIVNDSKKDSVCTVVSRTFCRQLCLKLGLCDDVTSAKWQVTLCDPILHVSSRSDEASCKLLYSVYYCTLLPY